MERSRLKQKTRPDCGSRAARVPWSLQEVPLDLLVNLKLETNHVSIFVEFFYF